MCYDLRFRTPWPDSTVDKSAPTLLLFFCITLDLGPTKALEPSFATSHSSDHARPFVGVFQKSISIRFINFWRYFPTKTRKWLQERGRDTPTKGLVWAALCCAGGSINCSAWLDSTPRTRRLRGYWCSGDTSHVAIAGVTLHDHVAARLQGSG